MTTNEENRETPTSLWQKLKEPSKIIFTFFAAISFIAIAIAFATSVFYSHQKLISESFTNSQKNNLIIYVVSWVLLLLISYTSVALIREIIRERADDVLRKRANYIAIIIGLVLIIFLFKQPYLELLFGKRSTSFWTRAILFSGGMSTGWVVWYLRQLKAYGEFFHVFLLTIITGFCWYARLTAPEEIQLTAVAFLLGSLFRVAKDYLDKASEKN